MVEENREVVKKGLLIICGVVFLFAISYAIFTYTGYGKQENKLSTGTLILTLNESTSEGITLADTVPVTDEEGLTFPAYTFSVQNTGTLKSNFQVSLVDDMEKYTDHGCLSQKMDQRYIKYSFERSDGTIMGILNTTNGVLDTGVLAPGETKSYTLRLWIDSETGNEVMGTHFHGKIQIKAIQEGHTNYDTGE